MATINSALFNWLEKASPEQARQLAKTAKTSVAQLRHIAYGRRRASADLAQRLAHASETGIRFGMRLNQRELCVACAKCPIAK